MYPIASLLDEVMKFTNSNGLTISKVKSFIIYIEIHLMEEGDNTRLACDKLWDDTPKLEGQGATESCQPRDMLGTLEHT